MKTIEEKIAVMQAFVDGKRIEAKVDGGAWAYLEAPVWDWDRFDYRVKQDAPRTWEEFCEQYNRVQDEYYIDGSASDICHAYHTEMVRRAVEDANLLKTSEDAEGLIALIKLKRLRDAWWGDWRPDVRNGGDYYYISKRLDRNWEIVSTFCYKHFLVFKTREMAEEFLSCFKDLIEKAEMWL